MAIDIPLIYRYLGEVIGPSLRDGGLPLPQLNEAILQSISYKKSGAKLLAEVLLAAIKSTVSCEKWLVRTYGCHIFDVSTVHEGLLLMVTCASSFFVRQEDFTLGLCSRPLSSRAAMESARERHLSHVRFPWRRAMREVWTPG